MAGPLIQISIGDPSYGCVLYGCVLRIMFRNLEVYRCIFLVGVIKYTLKTNKMQKLIVLIHRDVLDCFDGFSLGGRIV